MEDKVAAIKSAIYNDNRQLLLDQLSSSTSDASKLAAVALFFTIKWQFQNKQSSISLEWIKLLLDLGADVNSLHNGATIFGYACSVASADVVLMMFDYGADLNVKDSHGRYPVQVAFATGNEPIVNLFLELGLDVDIVNRLHLLHHLLQSGQASMDVVTKLVKLGADVNAIIIDDSRRTTVLECSIATGDLQIVKYLLDNGANVKRVTNPEFSVLDMAVKADKLEIAKLLLNRGANTEWGCGNVLALAAENGNCQMFEMLLSNGFEFDGYRIDKAMFRAVERSDNTEMVQLLLDHRAEINEADDCGLTPLRRAMRAGCTEVCRLLVKHMVFWKATGGLVMEDNWNALKSSQVLVKYRKQCESEMKVLKKQRFNPYVRYLDVMSRKNDEITLAFLIWRESEILRVARSSDFIRDFPIYGGILVDNVNSAVEKDPLNILRMNNRAR